MQLISLPIDIVGISKCMQDVIDRRYKQLHLTSNAP